MAMKTRWTLLNRGIYLMAPKMEVDGKAIPLTENDAKKFIKGQLQLIKIYSWLVNSFLSEFFADDLWSNISPSWQKCFNKLSIDEFHKLISLRGEKRYSLVLPLSLQAYVACCHCLAFPRKQLIKETSGAKVNVPNGGHVEHNFRKHVKLKKQYEVRHLSQLIKAVANEVNCFQSVDVGGGLGHLSRYLALVHKFKVITIESEGHHKLRAEQYDRETIKDLKKTKKKESSLPQATEEHVAPIHITKLIPIDIKPGDFIRLVMASKDEIYSAYTTDGYASADVDSTDMSQENAGEVKKAIGENSNKGVSESEYVEKIVEEISECRCKESLKLEVLDRPLGNVSEKPSEDERTFENKDGRTSNSKDLGNGSLEFTEKAINSEKKKESFILVGLHACGNLSPTLLRSFVNCPEVKGIVLVGCCYMKLTCDVVETSCDDPVVNEQGHHNFDSAEMNSCNCDTGEPCTAKCGLGETFSSKRTSDRVSSCDCMTSVEGKSSDFIDGFTKINGFPMSNFLRKQNCPEIGWDAFELACHNLDNYLNRLKDDKDKLKLQCYRAVLEVVIRKLKPDIKNPQIRCQKIKGAVRMTFQQYAEIALQRIHVSKPPSNLYEELDTESLLSRWKEVIIYYCLRLMLGPVIESLVLADRCLYLIEEGYPAHLCPVFDAKVSPRNFAVVAMKNKGDLCL